MNEAKRHDRVTQLFLEACELPEEKRAAFLRRQCADDPELLADVETMLQEDSRNPGFLETPALGEGFDVGSAEGATGAEEAPGRIPSQIGNFKVLEVLGEGGMGIVYLAEQDNPRRRVALKVIRPGIASTGVFKRFEQESHILGRLQHPGIAQVFDAGLTETENGRRPYFAMEYVKGLPLTKYVETHDLGTRDRLMLMGKVCDAVHHAHQKGVIHRDLKPGNILVDDSGQPKILDFGVARATDSDVQATTMRTDVGQLIGTISYMSPEQIDGDPSALDTRSDVYALGVVCYKLLTGRLPYRLENKLIHEAARIIRDDDPTPMSSINRIFRGDVETIVHKALEKDCERRYQSASDFGADIARYVRDEPIVARPASTAYQLGKFARRNRALATALAAVFVALLVGVTATSWALVLAESNLERARQAEELAQQRLRETEAANAEETRLRELAERRLNEANDARSAESDNRRRSIARIKQDIHVALEVHPELEASAYHLIGSSLRELGHIASADPFLVAAVALRKRELGEEHNDTLESLSVLANLRADQADRIGPESPEDRRRSEELDAEATDLFRQVYEKSVRTLGPENRLTVDRRDDLATMLPFKDAEPLHRENVTILRRTAGLSAPVTIDAQANLAYTLTMLGRHAEAIVEYREVLAVREKVYSPEEQRLVTTLGNLAWSLEMIGDYDAAVDAKRRSVAGCRKARGDEDPETLRQRQALARLLHFAGRDAEGDGNAARADELLTEAGQLYMAVLELRRKVLGSTQGNTLVTINTLAQLRQEQNDHETAELLFKELIPNSEAGLVEDHWHRAYFKSNYGNLLIQMKRFDDAERLLLFAYHRLKELKGDACSHTKRAVKRLVALYTEWRKPEEAARYRTLLSVKP